MGLLHFSCIVIMNSLNPASFEKFLLQVLASFILLFACWVIFHDLLSSAEFFQKLTFIKNSFSFTVRVSNGFDLDQARRSVRPDLDPNCLQKLTADDTGRQRV